MTISKNPPEIIKNKYYGNIVVVVVGVTGGVVSIVSHFRDIALST